MNRFWFRKVAFNNDPPVVPPVTPPPLTAEQQKAFNDAIAVERRKGEEKNALLIQQMEALRKTGQMTKEEQEAAAAQVEQLRTEYMTKEQLAVDAHKRRENDLSSQVKTTTEERDSWKETFQKTLVQNEILKAASNQETEAWDKGQMLDFLQPKAKVIQALDADNKPIPKTFIVKIPMTVADDKGVSKVIELDPIDALKKMMEMPQHQNLFKSKVVGGLGGNNEGGGVEDVSFDEANKDPEKWKAYRLKHGYEN